LEAIERQHIARILAAESGNISIAARILGINRTTLYHKIKKYGLST
jgi:transcriptional regulator of acetoin/glycerol metabolism